MATTFTNPALGQPATTVRDGGGSVTVYAELALTVAPVINDVYQMINVPAGARVISWGLGADDLDSGTAITLSLGDGASTARYVSASTIAQTGGVPVVAPTVLGTYFKYTTADTIDILCAAAPTTFVAGTIRCHVTYVTTVTAS
jgi:hypothetical protein